MGAVIRTRATVAWAVLIVLTTVSWALGSGHGLGTGAHTATSLVILAVAAFKIRLVGLYFMELREAPLVLRGAFEAYCMVLLALVAGMFVLA